MKRDNFENMENNPPQVEYDFTVNKDEEEGDVKVLANARERWLEIMKGQVKEKEGERIDFEKIIPDLEYFFGENFTIKPGKWWMTATAKGEKTLFYPREFGLIPHDASPEEREEQIAIQEGGVLHEMGHHVAVVKSLEAMMREADTGERILGDLSLGEAGQARINEAIKEQAEDLERLSVELNLGPHVGNLMFLKDLQNVVLDVWLESYLSKYPNKRFAEEAKHSISTLNNALFEEMPETLASQQLSGQFKSAFLLRAMRPDLMVNEQGEETWFSEGFVSPEVKEALQRIKKDKVLEKLTDTDELADIFMPEERLKWIKKKKLQESYYAIRREFINLLKIDFERAVQNKADGEGEGKEGEGQGGKGKKGDQQTGDQANQDEMSETEGDEAESGKQSDEAAEQGDEPTSFDDLSAEQQAELINEFIDRLESEEIGTSAMSEDEARNNESIDQLSREAIQRELDDRRREEDKLKGKKQDEASKDNETKDDTNESEKRREDKEKEQRNRQRGKIEKEAQGAQRHGASEMERSEQLGLSVEGLREFEKKRTQLDASINYFRDELIDLFQTKLEPEKKTHRPEGHLMPGHFTDFLQSVSRGDEPKTFEYLSFKQVIPSIDLLFLVDHSSSMSENNKNEKAAEAVLLFGEALMRAEEYLNKKGAEGRKKRDFLREGLITFSDKAVLQKPLDEPLNEKSVAEIYFAAKNISGGGTADAEALNNLINYLKDEKKKYHGRQKVMNIVVVVSDGQGEKEKVGEVLKTAADLPNTLFVTVGAGSGTSEVLDTWKGSFGKTTVVPVYVPDEKIDQMPQEIVSGMKDELRNKFAGI